MLTLLGGRAWRKVSNCPQCLRFVSSKTGVGPQGYQSVFDRRCKLIQSERAAANPDRDSFDFLKEEIGYRISDRILDVARKMDVAVDIGSGRGWVTRHMTEHSVGKVTAIELSSGLLESAPDPEDVPIEKIAMDIDNAELPFKDNSGNDLIKNT